MTWRLAGSLVVLRRQIDELYPNRDRSSDGTIGDQRHQAETSDHNPWVDGNIVTALDIDRDLSSGVNAAELAEALRASRDPRIKYIISQRRIANFHAIEGHPAFTWRPYYGVNPHDEHFHISVRPLKMLYDDLSLWAAIPQAMTAPRVACHCEQAPPIAAVKPASQPAQQV